MSITFAGITAARARLVRLSIGLREAASGEVVARAAEKVAAQVRAVAKDKLTAHEMSGLAQSLTVVDINGPIVQLHGMPPCNGEKWEGRSYAAMQPWWPFRRGMPVAIVKRAALIFARELIAIIGGDKGDLATEAALTIEEDAEAGRVRAAKATERKAYAARQRKLASKQKRTKKLREKLRARAP